LIHCRCMFLQFSRLGTVKVLDALRASDRLYVARLAWQVPKDGYTLSDQAARLRKDGHDVLR
jgi:hypothetical protein